MRSRISQHLRANVVAYVALFFSLGLGTAWALEVDSVKSKHIKDGQVKTADLDLGAVTPEQLDLGLHATVAAEGTTTSTTPAGLGASIGPIVTVEVPEDALVIVYAVAEIRTDGGTNCSVHIAEGGLPPAGTGQLLSSSSGSYVTKFSAPGTAGTGTPTFTDGGWVVFPASPGAHTYTMKYAGLGAGANCAFRNRELAVATVG